MLVIFYSFNTKQKSYKSCYLNGSSFAPLSEKMLFLSLFLCCKYFVLFNVLAKLNLIRISSSVSAAEPPRKVNGVIAINDNHKLDLSNPTEPINVYFAENLLLGCSFTKAESNDEEISENGIIKRAT